MKKQYEEQELYKKANNYETMDEDSNEYAQNNFLF